MRLKKLVFLAFVSAAFAIRAPAAESGAIEGRWLLTADLPQGKYNLAVEITRQPKGRISAAALGGGVNFSGATVKERELVLKGTSSFGPLTIRARIEGERMQGDWRAGSLSGRLRGEHQTVDSSAELRQEVFDEVCQRIDRDYFDPTYGGVDWRAVLAKYSPESKNLQYDAELFDLVHRMLSELKSSHLSFGLSVLEESTNLAGGAEAAATAEAPKAIAWRRLSTHAGYIKVAKFIEGSEFLQMIDRAFDELGDLPALVIDVRDNGGGTLGGAMRFGDHLFEQTLPVGFFATRSGLEKHSVSSMDDLKSAQLPQYAGYDTDGFLAILRQAGTVTVVTGGRAQPVYRGKVIVLINRATASAAEAFVAVLKELRVAVLVGPRATAGKMLSARQIKLSGGWNLTLPEADFRTPGGARIEGHGVAPDLVVGRASRGNDVPLIEAAKLAEH